VATAQSVTNLEQSPEDERKSRMIRYTVAMSLRVVCIVLGVYVSGWFMWVCFAGAIFLPYFAVVIANATGGSQTKTAKATEVVAPQLRIEATDFKIVDPEGK
jgi:predicted tellurium resistance membrane protein TerC